MEKLFNPSQHDFFGPCYWIHTKKTKKLFLYRPGHSINLDFVMEHLKLIQVVNLITYKRITKLGKELTNDVFFDILNAS